jgi:hypothetical protein
VGWDRKTSLAAAQTLAISAFLSGGDFDTFPLYPASNNLPIILSTSRTCTPPGLPGDMLFRLIVALKAAPGERDDTESRFSWPEPRLAPGKGDGDLPGEEGMADGGGGEEPSKEDLRPARIPVGELATIPCVVGILREPGASVEEVGMGDPAAPIPGGFAPAAPAALEGSRAAEALTLLPGRPLVAELKLDILPFRSSFDLVPLLVPIRDGVVKLPGPEPLTSIGEVEEIGDEGPSEREVERDGAISDMEVVLRLSARSLAESSFERVRPIFLDGVWPMLGERVLA